MADTNVIQVNGRERGPGSKMRALRESGLVPGVVYGLKQDPALISIDRRVLLKELYRGGFTGRVYELQLDGKKQRCLPRDVQLDPVSDEPIHVDFQRLSAHARVAVNVAVHFLNEDDSPGLRRGGVLNVVRHEVELECPADAIPEFLELDLTGADIGDALKISIVKLPAGVAPTITDRDFTIATIAASSAVAAEQAEEQEEAAEEAVAEEKPEPEEE